MTYLIIFVLLIWLTYRYDYKRIDTHKITWIVITWLLFVLVAGLRYRIGTDSIRYETYYGEIPGLGELSLYDFKDARYSRYAPGFIFLNSVVKTFADDFTAFQFVHALIVCSAVVFFFCKNTRNVFFALTMFYVFQYLNLLTEVLRESLAISVFLLAWPFFKDGKWIKWYLMSIVAMLFHVSATLMLFLPLLCVPGIKELFIFGKRTILLCMFIILLAIAINKMFFQYIQLLEIADNISERANAYSKSNYGTSNLNILGVLAKFIVYMAYPIIAMCFINIKKKGAKLGNDVVKEEMLAVLGLYVVIFSMFIHILDRFNNYLIFFSILIVSRFVFDIIPILGREVRFKYIYWLLFLSPMFAGQIYSAYVAGGSKGGTYKAYMAYYPYSSRIEMSKDMSREKYFRYMRAR